MRVYESIYVDGDWADARSEFLEYTSLQL